MNASQSQKGVSSMLMVVLLTSSPHLLHTAARASHTKSTMLGSSTLVNRIAFESDRDGNYEIYVMNSDGTNQTRLTSDPKADLWPNWSPSGTRIAFHTIYAPEDGGQQEINIISSDGSGRIQITNSRELDGAPDWSPDGLRLAFTCTMAGDSAGDREICVMNADGSGRTALTNNSVWDGEVSWSPDGSQLTFYSLRDGNYEVYVMNADGTNQVRLTNNPAEDWPSGWSPNGNRILFNTNRDGNHEIYVMNADGSGQTRLTYNPANDTNATWAPDGALIAFSSDRDGDYEIYVMNADGTGQNQLTNNSVGDNHPEWWGQGCETPFFWQRDKRWKSHELRSAQKLDGTGTICGTNYDTLGEGGCTLTSATMLFRHYGANQIASGVEMNPANLSDCMNTKACPFDWLTGVSCNSGKATNPRRATIFSYEQLNLELNKNHRPVILQMCRPKGACNWEGPITHWVLVVGGQGTDPANYTIWDPWFECGQNMRLNSRSDTWDFVGMAVYDGTPTCNLSTEVPLCARSVSPVGLPARVNAAVVEDDTATPVGLTASSTVSGTAVLYRATYTTMTVHLAAQSSVGSVTDMVIWSDTISNTIWQPFAPYVWLPISDFVYAQFRDDMGNLSAVVSDTPNPSAPPVAPDPDRVLVPLVTR